MKPTHRCRICGMTWTEWEEPDIHWSQFGDGVAGPRCGEFALMTTVEPLSDEEKTFWTQRQEVEAESNK